MTAVLDRALSGTPHLPVASCDVPLAHVVGADLQVPLANGASCRYANFDYAASAPALVSVHEHVQRALATYASVHRGAGYPSQVSTSRYETARDTVARFVNAAPDQVAVFTRNTTDALNLLASCVPGETVVLDVEHHANFLPWERRGRRVVPAADTIEETLRLVVAALCCEPAPALLAVTGASNVTGEMLPLAKLADLAHRCGARIAVDAAQLAPHRRIDLAGCGIDYAAFSGHKLYAPYGAGVLVGRRDWLDAAPPYLAGGGAVRDVTADGAQWHRAPQRHEGGTPNLLGATALAAACDALDATDAAVLQQHEQALVQRLRSGLSALPRVRLPRIWADSTEGVGIVAFTVDGIAPADVAAYLSAVHGIGVRDGRFCAHPLLARLNLPAAVRASVGLGSCTADVDRLVAAVAELPA